MRFETVSKMRVQYEDGEIRIDLYDLLEKISGEQKIKMIESLSFDDDIIRHIVSQIITGYAENGWFASHAVTPTSEPIHAIDWACREIAKRSDDITKRQIERLEKALKNQKIELDVARKDILDLISRFQTR